MAEKAPKSRFDIQEEYKKYQNVLKGAKMGEVHTRFPPEPSGFLHIGHVKASMINYHYAKMYNGTMTFRFDDTNPSKEKTEFVESIIEDLKTLGISWAQHTNTSDHFDVIKKHADDLIDRGLAYCDDTPAEEMKTQRQNKIESKYRNTDAKTNKDLFEKMWYSRQEPKENDYSQWCLRVKIDMQSKNGVMRDPVIYRINYTPHYKTGTKYTCYPTYDFICPIVDSLEGVTYAMRTMEYADRDHLYKWFLDTLKIRPVKVWEFSRLNMVNTLMSKRKLQWFVDQGLVTGWDDPRMPTVKGILRRGLHVESLTQFMLEQGPSKMTNCQTWDKLWSINKKFIDPICPRLTALKEKNISKMILLNVNKSVQYKEVPVNPLNDDTIKEMGNRQVAYSSNLLVDVDDAKTINTGEKITLMRLGNVNIVTKIEQKDGSIILEGQYNPDDKDFKKTQKINWLCADADNQKVNLVEYDFLINVDKYDEDTMKFDDIINKESKFVTAAISDPYIKQMKTGDCFQYERRGYYKIDNIDTFELVYTPDGKAKSMSKNIQGEIDAGHLASGGTSKGGKGQSLEQQKLSKKQQKKQQQQSENNKGAEEKKEEKKEGKQDKKQQKQDKKEGKQEKKEQKQEKKAQQSTQVPDELKVKDKAGMAAVDGSLANSLFVGGSSVGAKDAEMFLGLVKQKWDADGDFQTYPNLYRWFLEMNNFSRGYLESLVKK